MARRGIPFQPIDGSHGVASLPLWTLRFAEVLSRGLRSFGQRHGFILGTVERKKMIVERKITQYTARYIFMNLQIRVS